MNWTDERVELLKKLWSEGLSASQIAAQLGGVSRNAVIGKVHRLKLSGRGKTSSTQTRSKKVNTTGSVRGSVHSGASQTMVRTSVTKSVGATALQAEYAVEAVAHTVLKPAADVVVPISRRLSLLQLSERTCKWPVGDPLNEDFHFCGNDSGDTSPYCTYHSKLAFQPASERRRAR
ncbi:GcrA cell cycle regulator [Phyllobacterium phragmitis]|uniref:GcrA cell cycle regulator n=1 Tax=Phyllobacterium phragmitis TaxID=2670329 RepID=A0A2S9IKI4_9HYPH|nr:GcrA family cell cycle regulator [Phyllobacterium phragmitis]PRD41029.1 GcrA cell cycle regulator [Phyllobacterium phragmitis]